MFTCEQVDLYYDHVASFKWTEPKLYEQHEVAHQNRLKLVSLT